MLCISPLCTHPSFVMHPSFVISAASPLPAQMHGWQFCSVSGPSACTISPPFPHPCPPVQFLGFRTRLFWKEGNKKGREEKGTVK